LKLTYLENERIHIEPEDKTELRGIKSWFDRYVDGYMFSPIYKNKLWNGKRTEYDSETNTLPMGLWKEVFKCCEEFGYSFNFVNKKEFPINRDIKLNDFQEFIKDFFKDYKFQPREYQIRVAFNILKNRYCNIAVATSGGKTLIYSMVLFYLISKYPKKRFLLVVPSKTLVSQFFDDVIEFNQNKLNLNIQEIFGEEEKPRTLDPTKESNFVIATFQSLTYDNIQILKNGKEKKTPKYPKEWFKDFWSITVDEAHRSKSDSYSKKILKYTLNNAYYRWGMSGSFPVDESYEMMSIMSKTGPVVDTVKARELMDNGFITQVKIKQILMYHNNYQFAETLEIVGSRDKKSAYDLEVEKIQESPHRLDVINQIVSKCKSNTLVLFHNISYGTQMFEYLKELNPDKDFFYIDGSVKENGSKKNPENSRKWIKLQMEKTDRVKILIASFATLGTGVSINAINNVIFTQSFKKEQIIIQSIGRALRLHKDKKMAYVFDLVDIFNFDDYEYKVKKSFKNILLTHGEKRRKIYNTEDYPFDTIKIQLTPPV
jgi:superfamily II DNA or RNA helicase